MDTIKNHDLIRLGVAAELREYTSARPAVARVVEIYLTAMQLMRSAARRIERDSVSPDEIDRQGYYPLIAVRVTKPVSGTAGPLAFGHCESGPGLYYSTITKADHFRDYLLEQLELLIRNHGARIFVGRSTVPIPFVFVADGEYSPETVQAFASYDNRTLVDSKRRERGHFRLAQFEALEVDFAWSKLEHYTGTDPAQLQNFILFTNYPMYFEAFAKWARAEARRTRSGYQRFVMPKRDRMAPQMPALHLTRGDGNGISLINIGVGPSNAVNMFQKIAVFRPHLVLMVGHCAGLRSRQKIGGFVVGSAYARKSGLLVDEVPMDTPIPVIGEVNTALKTGLAKALKLARDTLGSMLESATITSVPDRDWETKDLWLKRVADAWTGAVDMESADIAASGLLYAVPTGVLLCISDKPLHGKPKLPNDAQAFYRRSKEVHLLAAIYACVDLRSNLNVITPHSRKIRRSDSPPFR